MEFKIRIPNSRIHEFVSRIHESEFREFKKFTKMEFRNVALYL